MWRRSTRRVLPLARVEVAGDSMLPTLRPGDRLLVWRTRRVRVGDLVVVPDPRDASQPVVKRVVEVVGGQVTLAGDNPSASTDSRVFGPVPRETIEGRVIHRYAPSDRAGRLRS
jgi:nickel-type superoxide dismutase maturation protease